MPDSAFNIYNRGEILENGDFCVYYAKTSSGDPIAGKGIFYDGNVLLTDSIIDKKDVSDTMLIKVPSLDDEITISKIMKEHKWLKDRVRLASKVGELYKINNTACVYFGYTHLEVTMSMRELKLEDTGYLYIILLDEYRRDIRRELAYKLKNQDLRLSYLSGASSFGTVPTRYTLVDKPMRYQEIILQNLKIPTSLEVHSQELILKAQRLS